MSHEKRKGFWECRVSGLRGAYGAKDLGLAGP